jgi:hypothetical protein
MFVKDGFAREEFTYEDLVDLVRSRDPLVWTRWGDGEWASLLGRQGKNCDGVRYSTVLARELGSALAYLMTFQNYTVGPVKLGLQNYAVRQMGPEIESLLMAFHPRGVWHDADLVHRASQEGKLLDLVMALRDDSWVLVGPEWLQRFPGPVVAVPCLAREASLEIALIEAEIMEILETLPNPVITLSCGPAAKILAARLWKRCSGQVRILDLGSALDPWGLHRSRGYMRKADMVAANPGVMG